VKTCPRKKRKEYPPGIDPEKLPERCYYDARGKGRWYTIFDDNGKSVSRKIAEKSASMAELHTAIEQFYKDGQEDKSTFKWLADQYLDSDQFKKLALRTRKNYTYSYRCICAITARNGKSLSETDRSKWTTPDIQKIVDQMARERGPTSAVRNKEFISRVFNWGINRGHCVSNPVVAIELPEMRQHRPMPSPQLYARIVAYARQKAEKATHRSAANYIWQIMEVDYLCRLRGIEARSMTEDKLTEQGIECQRAKGSSTNITVWNDRLRFAIDEALKERDRIWAKKKKPINLNPKDRPVFVNTLGEKITASAWQNAWRDFLFAAIKDGIMTKEEWFGLHAMKRKGITDTEGSRADKQDASGLKSANMVDIYDKGVKVVKPASE
jgi:site-specific recombinase XerD